MGRWCPPANLSPSLPLSSPLLSSISPTLSPSASHAPTSSTFGGFLWQPLLSKPTCARERKEAGMARLRPLTLLRGQLPWSLPGFLMRLHFLSLTQAEGGGPWGSVLTLRGPYALLWGPFQSRD